MPKKNTTAHAFSPEFHERNHVFNQNIWPQPGATTQGDESLGSFAEHPSDDLNAKMVVP